MSWSKNRIYIYGFVSAAIMFAISTILAATHKNYMGWEVSIFHFVNNWPDSLRLFFLAATVAHQSLLISLVAVVVAFFLKAYKLAWRLAILTFGGYGVTAVAKHFVDRARPPEVLADVHVRSLGDGAGYPSGHTMIMTIVMLAVLPYLPRKFRWLPFVVVGLMMVSRIYLSDHVPLDVIGGLAIGVGCVCFLQILPEKFQKNLKLNTK